MKILFFGTYEADRHDRVQIQIDGLRELGEQVSECVLPLGLGTHERLRLLRRPWRLPWFVARLARLWLRLWRQARRLPRPDAIVVGYMGHFDVHLARRIWRDTPIALDHMISGADTARDRKVERRGVLRLLEAVDRAAVRTADVPFVDTEEGLDLLAGEAREAAVVVPIGAPGDWYREPRSTGSDRLQVVFFGSFTPLQGSLVIATAIATLADRPIDFLMFGRGQELDEAKAIADRNPNVTWGWVQPEELPDRVADCDVCLGIFGTSEKALRVVPNKVYQGAAAGCALVTSDTPPQVRALGDAAAYVPPGDADALAGVLLELEQDRSRVDRLGKAASRRAREAFTPASVARPLRDRLRTIAEHGR